jgi:hypothetical protein
VNILLGGEQSVSSDKAENVSNNSSMKPDKWTNSGAGRHFPFTGKLDINVDLENPGNLLEYFELFCMPDIVEVIVRETNQCVQNF